MTRRSISGEGGELGSENGGRIPDAAEKWRSIFPKNAKRDLTRSVNGRLEKEERTNRQRLTEGHGIRGSFLKRPRHISQ